MKYNRLQQTLFRVRMGRQNRRWYVLKYRNLRLDMPYDGTIVSIGLPSLDRALEWIAEQGALV